MPVSREVGILASIFAIAAALSAAMQTSWKSTVVALTLMIDQVGDLKLDSPEDGLIVAISAAQTIAVAVGIPLAIIMVFAVAASAVQNPTWFVRSRIKPDVKRISVFAAFGRLFSRRTLVEFSKTLTKFIVVSITVSVYLGRNQAEIFNVVIMDPIAIPVHVAAQVAGLITFVVVVMLGIVGADWLWTRFKWRADLRMSKQEVKDEQKQSEGDPIVRARQRSLARDRARRRMISAVPRATMVIANPTHFAVALRYVREELATPIVIAKGLDNIALKIREIAESHGIPVIEDKALARSLYAAVKPDRPIPPEFYKAVAEVVLFLMSRNQSSQTSSRRAP